MKEKKLSETLRYCRQENLDIEAMEFFEEEFSCEDFSELNFDHVSFFDCRFERCIFRGTDLRIRCFGSAVFPQKSFGKAGSADAALRAVS